MTLKLLALELVILNSITLNLAKPSWIMPRKSLIQIAPFDHASLAFLIIYFIDAIKNAEFYHWAFSVTTRQIRQNVGRHGQTVFCEPMT